LRTSEKVLTLRSVQILWLLLEDVHLETKHSNEGERSQSERSEASDDYTFLYRRRSGYFGALSSLTRHLTTEIARTSTIEKSIAMNRPPSLLSGLRREDLTPEVGRSVRQFGSKRSRLNP
jgi:hypothetical protein